MSTIRLLDSPGFDTEFAALLQKQLLAAAEPVLQQALADMEAQMRKRLAAAVVGAVDSSYDICRMADRLIITVNLASLTKTHV